MRSNVAITSGETSPVSLNWTLFTWSSADNYYINGNPLTTRTIISADSNGWSIEYYEDNVTYFNLANQVGSGVYEFAWQVPQWSSDIGVVEFLNPASDVLMSGDAYDAGGGGSYPLTGTYVFTGLFNYRPLYQFSDFFIRFNAESLLWEMYNDITSSVLWVSQYFNNVNESPLYPWDPNIQWSNNNAGEQGSFTLTEIRYSSGDVPTPSYNTFGLPAESVALIVSRFGSVANFLRLRNQGQI